MEYESTRSVPRKTFRQDVDKRSKEAMAEYLAGHFRYPTMNAWNRSTSYACDLKVTHLGLPPSVIDTLFDMMDADGFYDPLNDLVEQFGHDHGFMWQAGWNGRSGGYIVLYQGGRKPDAHKSFCTACGQRNWQSVASNGTKCGRCGADARVDFKTPPMEVYTQPGRSTDMDMDKDDFMEWDIQDLRERVKLVQEFDALADGIVEEAIGMALSCKAAEETVLVPSTRKVLVPKEEA